ncbi:MAG: VanZ family protein [Bacteroidales bacterium]|nr:VanZ family protein [Bacteroidales bacterium]
MDIEKIRTIDTVRIIYFFTFIISFILTKIGQTTYRSYIYENKIDDLGIADSIGNSGGIIVQIFFGLAIINPSRKKGLRLIIFFTLGYILYEFAQLILPKGVFDWQDVYGTLIGGVLGILIFLLIHGFVKRNKQVARF